MTKKERKAIFNKLIDLKKYKKTPLKMKRDYLDHLKALADNVQKCVLNWQVTNLEKVINNNFLPMLNKNCTPAVAKYHYNYLIDLCQVQRFEIVFNNEKYLKEYEK